MTEKSFSRSNPLTLSYKDQQKFWKQQEEREKEKETQKNKVQQSPKQRTKVEALQLESTTNTASMTEGSNSELSSALEKKPGAPKHSSAPASSIPVPSHSGTSRATPAPKSNGKKSPVPPNTPAKKSSISGLKKPFSSSLSKKVDEKHKEETKSIHLVPPKVVVEKETEPAPPTSLLPPLPPTSSSSPPPPPHPIINPELENLILSLKSQVEDLQNRLEISEKLNTELSEKLSDETKHRKSLEENFGKLARTVAKLENLQDQRYFDLSKKINDLSETPVDKYSTDSGSDEVQYQKQVSLSQSQSHSAEVEDKKKSKRLSLTKALPSIFRKEPKEKDEGDSTKIGRKASKDDAEVNIRKSNNHSRNASLDVDVLSDEEKKSSLSSDESKKLSLEAVMKADLIKEQLSQRYANNTLLRRRQLEQMANQMATRQTRSKTSDAITVQSDKEKEKPSNAKEQLNHLLINRSPKEALVKKGIIQNNLFGNSLETMISGSGGVDIPLFLVHALAYLGSSVNLENMLFKPVDPNALDALIQQIQTSQNMSFFETKADPHLVAALVKEFFIRLPQPLLTYSLYRSFALWTDIDEAGYQHTSMHSLVFSLPPTNRAVLIYLVMFFENLLKQSEKNKSSIEAIAKLYGPILLRTPVMNSPPPTHRAEKGDDSVYLRKLEKMVQEEEATNEDKAGELVLSYMITNNKKLFEAEKETGLKYIMKDGNHLIETGTVDLIIEKLFDEFYLDTNYADVIFLTHPYFMTSLDLLKAIIDKYESTGSGNAQKSWQKRMQTRIHRLLKIWIGTHNAALKMDKDFVEEFKKFTEKYDSTKQEQVFHKFLDVCREERTQSFSAPTSPVAEKSFVSEKSILSSSIGNNLTVASFGSTGIPEDAWNGNLDSLDIVDYEPSNVALQLTNIDLELLKSIQPQEFLKKAFSDPKRSPNFTFLADQWNKRSMWVVSEILKRDKLAKRVNVISHFIRIAETCANLKNFHGSYAILAALSHSAVSRLEKTWEKLPKRITLVEKDLVNLFDMSQNYKNYRNVLHTASLPVIPYVGLFPRDLTALEEVPTFLDNDHKILNFGKLRDLWKILSQISKFQASKYKIIVNPPLSALLRALPQYGERELFDMSEQYEPPKKKRRETNATSAEPAVADTQKPVHKQYSVEQMDEFRKQSIQKYEKEKQEAESRSRSKTEEEYVSEVSSTTDSFSDEEDSVITTSSRIPMIKGFSIDSELNSSSEFGSVRTRSASMTNEEQSKDPTNLTTKEKALVIKESFSSKYANVATLRDGQIEKLGHNKRAKTDMFQRENIDQVFSKLNDQKSSEV